MNIISKTIIALGIIMGFNAVLFSLAGELNSSVGSLIMAFTLIFPLLIREHYKNKKLDKVKDGRKDRKKI